MSLALWRLLFPECIDISSHCHVSHLFLFFQWERRQLQLFRSTFIGFAVTIHRGPAWVTFLRCPNLPHTLAWSKKKSFFFPFYFSLWLRPNLILTQMPAKSRRRDPIGWEHLPVIAKISAAPKPPLPRVLVMSAFPKPSYFKPVPLHWCKTDVLRVHVMNHRRGEDGPLNWSSSQTAVSSLEVPKWNQGDP